MGWRIPFFFLSKGRRGEIPQSERDLRQISRQLPLSCSVDKLHAKYRRLHLSMYTGGINILQLRANMTFFGAKHSKFREGGCSCLDLILLKNIFFASTFRC